VILHGTPKKNPKKAKALKQRLAKQHPIFKIRLFTAAQLKTAQDKGSLYFMEHCSLGTLLYVHPKRGDRGDLCTLPMEKWLKRAKRHFKTEGSQIKALSKAADGLLKEKHYEIATFNLHQAFQRSFRLMERLCVGKSKSAHGILGHIHYCRPYLPQLTHILEPANAEEKEQLFLLENAQTVARYEDGYGISRAQVKQLSAKLHQFRKEMKTTFRNQHTRCQTMARALFSEALAKGSHRFPKLQRRKALGKERPNHYSKQLSS
jgi:HEPN domain-containing protein